MTTLETDHLPRHAAGLRDAQQRARIVEMAGQLFREIGFQKTTVADIARSLGMSSANVYRFFNSKAEINEAVGKQLMGEVEFAALEVVNGEGSASERLRSYFRTIEKMHAERCLSERKLHEMVEVALNEDWPIILNHIATLRMLTAQIITSGVDSGEFMPCNVELTAGIIQTAMICYCHPRLMVECENKPIPDAEEMLFFLIKAISA